MRTEQELQANLAAYWRRLNAACGVPAGTHPDDPNPPRSEQRQAAPKHRVRQALPMPENEHIHASLLSDPEVLAILQDHWNDTFIPNDLGPAPADPAAQLRWYTLRDLNAFHHSRHRADFKDARKHRTRKRVDMLIARLAHHDPLHAGTMQVMNHFLAKLPESARKAVATVFSRCPLETLEFYKELRGAAGKVMGANHHRRRRDGR